MDQRTCALCGDPLPAGSQRNRVYCSKACAQRAYKRDHRADLVAAARERRQATAADRAAERLAAKAGRICCECGQPLPASARWNRRFCSRKCINARSLREHPEQRVEGSRRWRARRLQSDVLLVTERDWQRLVVRYDGRCAYCGARTTLTRDHVIPLARGGRHSIGNLLPACFPCNVSKRDDLLAYWRHGVPSARLGPR